MISVITPVVNGRIYIERCINSVIYQECSNIEHLIIDGGSKDGTIDIVREYAYRYSHIRWISEKDSGQSEAMNKGLLMAQGEIVGFLNVDDYYEKLVLNRVLEIFKTLSEPSLVVGNCYVRDHKGEVLFKNIPNRLRLFDLLLGPSINPYPINPSAYFYHKSLHNKVGLYDIQHHYALDLDFLLRAVQNAHTYYFDEDFGNFCMVKDSKTYIDSRRPEGYIRLEKLLKYYRRDLCPIKRLIIWIMYPLFKSPIGGTIAYFYRHPDEIIGRISKRIKFPAG